MENLIASHTFVTFWLVAIFPYQFFREYQITRDYPKKIIMKKQNKTEEDNLRHLKMAINFWELHALHKQRQSNAAEFGFYLLFPKYIN